MGRVPRDELKPIPVEIEGLEVTPRLSMLGVRKVDNGKLELLVYGSSKTPLLTVPLTKASKPHKWPIELEAQREGDAARAKLLIVGQYEAVFQVTAPGE